MKNLHYLIISIVILSGCNSINQSPINKLNDKVQFLKGTRSFEYTAYLELNMEYEQMQDTNQIYIEKFDAGELLPLKYEFESKNLKGQLQLFDGQRFYSLDKNERTIIEINNAPMGVVESNQYLSTSPYYIQIYIEHLLQNDKDAITFIGDTLIGNKKALQYQIVADYVYLLSKRIVKNGDIHPNGIKAENIKKIHRLIVDDATHLPISFTEVLENGYYISVRFAFAANSSIDYDERSKILTNAGFLKMKMEDYMQIQMVRQNELLGSQAKDFSLFTSKQKELQLLQFISKPVLLVFWFPGCGFCLKAIPSINEIYEKYKTSGFNILAIYMSNASDAQITKYIEVNNVQFPVLTQGKEVSIQYGVNSGPTFVLLDKDHKIIYLRSGLDSQELVKEIEKIL